MKKFVFGEVFYLHSKSLIAWVMNQIHSMVNVYENFGKYFLQSTFLGYAWLDTVMIQLISSNLMDPISTGRKLNVHKTFRRRPERLLNVLCTFNLRPVSTGEELRQES